MHSKAYMLALVALAATVMSAPVVEPNIHPAMRRADGDDSVVYAYAPDKAKRAEQDGDAAVVYAYAPDKARRAEQDGDAAVVYAYAPEKNKA
ncbi:hypothetical protein GTA08_BOTSDO08548 [Botryosphaeria dothidea]|uniref:Uncharacterized protein n=1 Tax=Botryosphaeria dothidea TaxID=55169 RepID=A0A8H4MYS6_9PEZI|nr:hypothetical protein GTA08_BOTSDO08548 [Botryosphaeria dothidea]